MSNQTCGECRDFEWRDDEHKNAPAGSKYSVCIKDPDDPMCVQDQENGRYCFRPAIAVTDGQYDAFVPLGGSGRCCRHRDRQEVIQHVGLCQEC